MFCSSSSLFSFCGPKLLIFLIGISLANHFTAISCRRYCYSEFLDLNCHYWKGNKEKQTRDLGKRTFILKIYAHDAKSWKNAKEMMLRWSLYFLHLKLICFMTQTSSSSPWSGDLGGNYCQGCWCAANLDKSGFVRCTWHSNWEEFAALPPGMVIGFIFSLSLSFAELNEFKLFRYRILWWHFFMRTCWIRLLVDYG